MKQTLSSLLVAWMIGAGALVAQQTPASPQTPPQTPPPAGQRAEIAPEQTPGYVVGRNDRLKVDVSPDPNPGDKYSRDYTVGQSDGKITFPDLGPIKVEGMTTRQIEDFLGKELVRKEFLSRAPTVTVEVISYRSQTIYVNGEVRTPGQQNLQGDQMTLGRAVVQAGGYQANAGSTVTVLHPLRPGMGIVTDKNDPNVEVTEFIRENLDASGVDPVVHEGDTIIVSKAEVYFINGEVKSAGEKVWKNGTTLGDALAGAGGMTDKGSLGRSFIRRKNTKGQFKEVGKLKLETPILPKDEIVIRKKLF